MKEKNLLEISQAEDKVAHRTVTVQPFVVKFTHLVHHQVPLIVAYLPSRTAKGTRAVL